MSFWQLKFASTSLIFLFIACLTALVQLYPLTGMFIGAGALSIFFGVFGSEPESEVEKP